MPPTIQLLQPLRDVKCSVVASPSVSIEREQAAYDRGRAEGEQAVRQQLLAMQTEFERMQRGVLQSLQQAVPRVIQESEGHLIAMAIEVARKLVSDLPVSIELVEAAVREALVQAGKSSEVSVSLHPEDFALLEKQQSPLLAETAGGKPVQFTSSTEVSRGGCLVQTAFGGIDNRRETKLKLLKETLLP